MRQQDHRVPLKRWRLLGLSGIQGPLTRYFYLAALVAFILLPAGARCEGWSPGEARAGWAKFALGFAGGIAAHEFGHYVVARSKGYEVGRDGFSIIYPGADFSPGDQLQVASAGFQAQWLLAELVLRDGRGNGSEAPPGDLGAGVVCAHLAITAAYLAYLKNHRQGDVAGMASATGYSENRIALALAVPGVLDAWRLFGNDVPEWVPELSAFGKGLGVAWIWTY